MSHYRAADPDLACAALLHDAVEDHAGELAPGGGQPEALALVAAVFGNRVAGLVAAVTNPVWPPGRDADEQYREHVAVSLQATPGARVIKISDFVDNGVGLIDTAGPETAPADRHVPRAGAGAAGAGQSPGHAAGR